LGNLLVVVGNGELSNEMATYMTDQEVFIKISYYSSGSCVTVERKYRQEFSFVVVPSRDTVYWIIKQFEGTGTVCLREVNVARLFERKKSVQQGRR
jgi:hypothetical protein